MVMAVTFSFNPSGRRRVCKREAWQWHVRILICVSHDVEVELIRLGRPTPRRGRQGAEGQAGGGGQGGRAPSATPYSVAHSQRVSRSLRACSGPISESRAFEMFVKSCAEKWKWFASLGHAGGREQGRIYCDCFVIIVSSDLTLASLSYLQILCNPNYRVSVMLLLLWPACNL